MKLSHKLIAFIVSSALLLILCSSFFSYYLAHQRLVASTQSDVKRHVSAFERSASAALASNNLQRIRTLRKALVGPKILSCAIIRNNRINLPEEANCRGEHFANLKLKDLVSGDSIGGELIVYLDRVYFNSLVRRDFLLFWGLIVGNILLLSMFTLGLVYFRITRPISKLTTQLIEVKFDKHIHLLDEGIRVDELAGISRAVNQLLISAKKRIIVEQQIAQKTQHLTNNFRMIFELSKNALAVTDERLRLESSNPRFAELVSHLHNVDTLIGSDKWLECTADDAESLRQTMLSSTVLNTPVTTEIELTAKLDTEIVHSFYNLTFIKAADDYGGLTILVFISDITEHHRKLLESEYEANHDGLTKLLNRAAATKKIRYLLSSDDEERFDVAIVMIDLDGFKSINDELGHDAGDAILRSVSRRISRVVSNVDVVCRWGGDEFLVALRGLGMAEASAKSNAILSEIQRPVKIMDGVERSVGASIGLSLSSESVRDFGSLFDQADKAMYQIKKSGKASVLVYSR